MSDERYRKLSQPPARALRPIQAGRLKGKTDINPQWRYEAMTEVYGLCGVGWRFEVIRKWTEPGPDGQVFAFADINLYVSTDGKWSDPIPGNGGNMLVAKEKAGLHANDEAFKMAITDALSTATKMIGVGADVYAGLWNGSKYNRLEPPSAPGVNQKRLDWLKTNWAKQKAEILQKGDDEDLNKRENLRLFGAWVQQTLGPNFNLGGKLDVNKCTDWSIDDMVTCEKALDTPAVPSE